MTPLFRIIVQSPDGLEGELLTALTRGEALSVFVPDDSLGRTPIERIIGRHFTQKAIHCYESGDGYRAYIKPVPENHAETYQQ